MKKIYAELFDFLQIGDEFPTIIMGVLNLSPESFYHDSVYENPDQLKNAALNMIHNGAQILDLGARSTAPWSKKISIEEEVERIIPVMRMLCEIIPDDIIISIDTQYERVANDTFKIAEDHGKRIMINDVSCLKTDPNLIDFVTEKDLPLILMASKSVPGDLLTINEIVNEFNHTIHNLKRKRYDVEKLILDPGIGHWIEKKTYEYDLGILGKLNKLRILNRPILVAISRKSFIGTALNLPNPEDRLNGSLAATAIAVYNGAHIVRTHDVTTQLIEIVRIAEHIRRNT
jgi:dihydropteroate synthase